MLLITYEGAQNGRKDREFSSVSYHGKSSDDRWLVKVLSQEWKSVERKIAVLLVGRQMTNIHA